MPEQNPLEILLNLLSQQAGSRGSTFAGRVVPQSQTPDLKTLMTQMPSESPDAEGYAAAGTLIPLAAAKARLRPQVKISNQSIGHYGLPADAIVQGTHAVQWGGLNRSELLNEWLRSRDGSWVKIP